MYFLLSCLFGLAMFHLCLFYGNPTNKYILLDPQKWSLEADSHFQVDEFWRRTPFRGVYVDEFQRWTPFYLMNSRGSRFLRGCILMNSRGRPSFGGLYVDEFQRRTSFFLKNNVLSKNLETCWKLPQLVLGGFRWVSRKCIMDPWIHFPGCHKVVNRIIDSRISRLLMRGTLMLIYFNLSEFFFLKQQPIPLITTLQYIKIIFTLNMGYSSLEWMVAVWLEPCRVESGRLSTSCSFFRRPTKKK